MSKDKKTKGITLVALVVTLIVMLILTGVTIQGLTGTGLFKNAKIAATRSKYASAAEKVALAVNASYDNTGSLNNEYLADNINKIDGYKGEKLTADKIKYDLEIIVDGFEFTISSTGQITGNEDTQVATLPENTKSTTAGTEVKPNDGWDTQTARYIKTSDGTEITTLKTVSTVYAVSDGNANTIPVPYGFYYVGGTKTSGVVISDNEADKNKYAGQEDVSKNLQGNQFVWIPCTTDTNDTTKIKYQKVNWGYSNAGWDSATNSAEKTQIQKYGGFYIGRYEAGSGNVTSSSGVKFGDKLTNTGWANDCWSVNSYKLTGNVEEKADEIPFYHADYKTAVEMSEKMYNTNYVNSGLVTGTMWDVMLNFLATDSNTNVKSSDWGNYNNTSITMESGKYVNINSSGAETTNWTDANGFNTSSDSSWNLLTTGSSEQVKKKNLYDVAGNLWEWTQEASYYSGTTVYYMLRGGVFYSKDSDYPACYRAHDTVTGTNTHNSFRVALYLK